MLSCKKNVRFLFNLIKCSTCSCDGTENHKFKKRIDWECVSVCVLGWVRVVRLYVSNYLV